MATTNPPANSDPDHGTLGDDPVEQILTPFKRAVAFYARKSVTDLNQGPPEVQFDAFGKRYFEGAPVPLKHLFDTPLALQGPNMSQGVRRVTSGWGDARAQLYDSEAKNGTRKHSGLDFAAPVDEEIKVCADGVVTFVGFQNRPRGSTSVDHPHVDNQNQVLDSAGNVVARPSTLGHGGIFIQVKHNGDFDGYWTEYMHCSDVLVTLGQRVLKGATIGRVGRTGGNAGVTTGPHLHWQVRYRGVIVNPSFLVPHYRPNGELVKLDGTVDQNTASGVAAINTSTPMSAGAATMLNNVTNQLMCLERQAKCQNLDTSTMKAMQGTQSQLAAKNLNIHVSAMYSAIAKFQQTQPRIENGVYFNFETGLWSDQEAAPAAGTGL